MNKISIDNLDCEQIRAMLRFIFRNTNIKIMIRSNIALTIPSIFDCAEADDAILAGFQQPNIKNFVC